MKPRSWFERLALAASPALYLALLLSPVRSRGAGVTFITHGLNGNTDGWVSGMANQIPAYASFPGTNFTCYKVYFTPSGSSYVLNWSRVAGSAPQALDSGELLVKFDWSQLADGNSYNTYQVAAAATPALLSTNFISELGGHALAELPLHLVGHSRGGSLICQLAYQLGTNGVWVDQLTTLDPHPLNNDGFNDFIYSAKDAPARTYANVLFHDNYWQHLSSFIYGEPVAGAFVRQLSNLSGGYSGLSGPHSNVHLWYHGTLDPRTPTTDTEASLTGAERTNWWNVSEAQGAHAGFRYSLIGGGDRLSPEQPLGPGYPAIRDGYNQAWDLGAGLNNNRTALPANNGLWPSLIRFNRTQTNAVVQGQTTSVQFFYQWAQPSSRSASISFYLDDDLNPFNQNQRLLSQAALPGTGSSAVGTGTVSLTTPNTAPGWHRLAAAITAGGQTRFLYAPEPVQILPLQVPLTLDITLADSAHVQLGINGQANQTVVLQGSSDLVQWQALATNLLTNTRWLYTNAPSPQVPVSFYRAFLAP